MTRRGSLIYYLTAWICGCFFMSLSIWIKDLWGAMRISSALREAFGILFFYFYGLLLGAVPTLIFAFLLRQASAKLRCKTAWHWAIFGAILLVLLVGVLGNLGAHLGTVARNGWQALDWFASGPHIVLVSGWWLAIPAGAATGYLLARVQRAFEQPATPAPPVSA